MRLLYCLLFVLLLTPAAAYWHGSAGLHGWSTVKTGGGGQVTAVMVSSDGNTKLAITDTDGCWKWDNPSSSWKLITTKDSISTLGSPSSFMSGIYYAAIAPSDSNTYGKFYAGSIANSVIEYDP